MFCSNCGRLLHDNANFCSGCGKDAGQKSGLVNLDKAGRVVHGQSAPVETSADNLLSLFVGYGYDDYYRSKWFKGKAPSLNVRKRGVDIYSFNVAGLFLGFFWMCYRKMYGTAALLVVGMVFFDVLMMYTKDAQSYNMYGGILYGIMWILFTGILGNYFYLIHASKKIKKITLSASDPVFIEEELRRAGGTSVFGAIGMGVLLSVVMLVMYLLLAPEWY